MGKPRQRYWRPEWVHGLLALALTLLGGWACLRLFRLDYSLIHLLVGWLAAVNLVTFGYYGYDKFCARRGARRVPEVVLHGLSLVGGSPGAYVAMRTFRHKTIKGSFRLVFWSIALLQLALLLALAWRVWRQQT